MPPRRSNPSDKAGVDDGTPYAVREWHVHMAASARRAPMELNAEVGYLADDALLDLLLPFWQVVIGVCLVLVTIVSAHRLLLRGPSRMSRAIVVAGSAIVGVVVIGMLLSVASG